MLRVVESFWDNGNICSRIEINDGQFHGHYDLFSSKGNLDVRRTFFNGKQHGPTIIYFPNSKDIEDLFTYENGFLSGRAQYFTYFMRKHVRSADQYLNSHGGRFEGERIVYTYQ